MRGKVRRGWAGHNLGDGAIGQLHAGELPDEVSARAGGAGPPDDHPPTAPPVHGCCPVDDGVGDAGGEEVS